MTLQKHFIRSAYVTIGSATQQKEYAALTQHAAFEQASSEWLRRQCHGARRELKRSLKPLWRNVTRHRRARERALREAKARKEQTEKLAADFQEFQECQGALSTLVS